MKLLDIIALTEDMPSIRLYALETLRESQLMLLHYQPFEEKKSA